MISIDSVNILISLHPSMHFEVPYPTPTQWVLFSFFYSPADSHSSNHLFQSSFSKMKWIQLKIVVKERNFMEHPGNGRNYEWHRTKVAVCVLVDCGTVPILPYQPQFQITRSIKSSRTCGTVTYFLSPSQRGIISSYPWTKSYYIIYQL